MVGSEDYVYQVPDVPWKVNPRGKGITTLRIYEY